MKTIARNRTKRIAEIRASVLLARLHSRHHDFVAQLVTQPEHMWAHLGSRAKLLDHENGMFTVDVNGALWYRLYAAEYFATLGREAYEAGQMAAPALDGKLTKFLEGMAVGTGAAPIMQAWQDGYQAAVNEAADAVLTEQEM